jgi:hypothetical protein
MHAPDQPSRTGQLTMMIDFDDGTYGATTIQRDVTKSNSDIRAQAQAIVDETPRAIRLRIHWDGSPMFIADVRPTNYVVPVPQGSEESAA